MGKYRLSCTKNILKLKDSSLVGSLPHIEVNPLDQADGSF